MAKNGSKPERKQEAHVYLGEELARAVRASAAENGRSFQGEIRFALMQRYLPAAGQESK